MESKKVRRFDVALHSYLDRPIFDVCLNGKDIGVASGQPHRGAGGLMAGVAVPLGPQLVTWRLDGPEGTPRNGETVAAKNQPVLDNVNSDLHYLGVHIYPDDTVEIIPEMYWPDKTEKGLAINAEWERKNGRQ